jgi:peptidoglycan/LPS O-acetylase OafA/YrhL
MQAWIHMADQEIRRDRMRLWARLVFLGLILAVSALSFGYCASLASDLVRWTIGLGFAFVFGQIACQVFLRALRHDYMRLPDLPARGPPPRLVGAFESLVFTVAVGAFYQVPQALAGVFTVMGLWLGAKMLTGWNRADPIVVVIQRERKFDQRLEDERKKQQQEQDKRARGAFSALLAGALNLVIATVGGNIAANGVVVKGGALVVPGSLAIIFEAVEWTWRHLEVISTGAK